MRDLPDLANLDYVDRVNRAIDHILQHLDGSLRLEEVARIACFSPYHFHRIFKALLGETLNVFIRRVRLERALYLMSHRKGASLSEIALACGFSSASDFSRVFKAHHGVPPRRFALEDFRRAQRVPLKLERLPPGQNPDGFKVKLRELPARRVVYLRVHRPFFDQRVEGAARRLVDWAKARGLEGGQWLGYMWDDPEIVPLSKCRYDVAVEVPEDAVLTPGPTEARFASMRVAELDIAGPIELEQRALDWLYGTWLPKSGFAPAHQPAFEAWYGLPFAHGQAHFELRVQLAVVDAREPL